MVSKKAKTAAKGVPAAVGATAGAKAVKAAVSDAPAQARVLVDELNERLVPALQTAREHLGPALVEVRGRLGETVEDKVVPALHDAGERLAPVIASARIRAGETARDVSGRIADRAEPYAHEAARRGGNALEALKGTDVVTPSAKKRGGFFRKLLVIGGLGGLGYAAWRALSGSKSDPWTDSTDFPTGGLADKVKQATGAVQQTASGVADAVKSKVGGGTDSTDDGSPSAEEGAFVSDLGTFAEPPAVPVDVEVVEVVEVIEPVNPVPLDGVTEPTEDH